MNKVLVIDDDRDLRWAVRAALTAGGLETIEADGAEAGLRRACETLPDLILCDLGLGQGSGLDVLTQLRQNAATSTIPMILITASDDATIMRQGMDLGADDYLHKPFTAEVLLQAVQARLKKQASFQEQTARTIHDIEARYRLLFENSPDAIVVLAPPAWKLVEANPATLRLFAAPSREELFAGAINVLGRVRQPDGPSSVEQTQACIEAALRNGSHCFEWTCQRMNGSTFPATVCLARMEAAGQTLLQATIRDVSAQRHTELLLRARAELAEISAGGNLDGLLQEALDRAEQLTGSSIGFFHFVEADQQNLTLQTWSTNTLRNLCRAEGKGRHYAISEAGVWVDCVRTRAPVVHNDYASLPHRKGLPPGHAPIVREAVVPILRNGLVVCLLGVGNKSTDYTTEDVRRLEDLASIVADYAVRLRAEQALQDSERRYQTLAETSPAGVFRTNAQGETTYVNTRWCELAGLSAKEAMGSGWLRAVHPEDREAVVTGWSEARAKGGVSRADYRFLRSDGSVAWVMGQAVPEWDASGKLAGFVGTIADITQRKQTEEDLRRSETKYRRLHQTMRDAFVSVDMAGRIQECNAAFQEMLGYSETELCQMTYLDITPEKWHTFEARIVREQVLPRGDSGVYEKEYRRKDGTVFPIELRRVLLRDSAGKPVGMWATVRDVTERKRAEQMLIEERILLRTLIDALPDCIYAKDREARKTLANLADVRSLGAASEQEVLGKTDYELLDRRTAAPCYADDMRVILHGEPMVARQELILNPKGEQRWLETSKLPLRDAIGRIVGLVGIGHDITERKEAEQRLHDAHMIQNLILENSTVGVAFVRERHFVWANARLAEMLGRPFAEVQGASTRVLYSSDEQYEALARDAYPQLAAGQRSDTTLQLRRSDGSLFWCRFVGKALNPANPHQGSIWMFEDITERKEAEQARQDMEVQLRQAQKLESIGQLAAGIAHEINTPMQYIGDNTRFLQDAFGELRRVIAAVQESIRQPQVRPGLAEALAPLEAVLRSADVDYLMEEIPKAVDQSLQGTERVTKIVRAMKEFSHPGTERKTALDLNHAIECTLTVARNEYKYVADLETDFDPKLPLVPCLPGEFNQVILNLIINAAHAIADVVGTQSAAKGRITVRTRLAGGSAEVRVQDTGTGIPEGVRHRVFDPFFTTKPVGKGSGQGLAIARSVIVDKHGGTLSFETEIGRGTTFIIRLPLAPT